MCGQIDVGRPVYHRVIYFIINLKFVMLLHYLYFILKRLFFKSHVRINSYCEEYDELLRKYELIFFRFY